MSNITIALDAGHGGSDSGAIYNSRKEKDDALELTLAVGKILEENGINVFYTRTSDIYETPFKKASDANQSDADYFISIHRNSSDVPGQYSGVQTLVYSNDGIRAILADNINSELEKTGFKNLGTDERKNLVVLKRTTMPAVLIEVGFINNEKDNRIFDENFEAIAQGIADGILTSLYSQGINFNEIPESEHSEPISPIPDKSFSDTIPLSSETLDDDNNTKISELKEPENPNDEIIPDNLMGNYTTEQISPASRNNMPSHNTISYDDDIPNEKFYRVQVGAYKNKDTAQRMLNSLLVEDFPAFMIYEDGLYKVQVGAFRNLANAIKMERRLRRFRYNTYIAYT